MAHFTDIRALAFDLDGTLVDSAPGLADAIDRTLNDLRLPQAGLARVSTWIGNGADIMMARALTFALGREPQPEEQRDARALFDRHYADTVEAGSTLFPQVKETLAAFKAAAAAPAAEEWIAQNAKRGLAAQELYDLVTGMVAASK